MLVVRQRWPRPGALDVEARVRELLRAPQLAHRLDQLRSQCAGPPRIAVTAGSRGITDLVPVLRTVVAGLRDHGCAPFIAPCMGSHGGATARGQLEVLRSLGVSERSVGASIVSSLDVVQVATSGYGAPVYVGRDLVEADGVLVVNRIKPHTDFCGEIGSGIVKMLAVGMGKQHGAEVAHRLSLRHGFAQALEELAGLVLARLPVLGAIGIVEDQRDHTAAIELLDTSRGIGGLLPREIELERVADGLLPRLPFDHLDVLIVDHIGKEVSGAGMDPNVIGRRASVLFPQPERPRILRIYVRGLTAASHGNALGIGMADFVHRRLLDGVDRAATEINCIASSAPEDGRIPIALPNDREAVAACLDTCGVLSAVEARVAWIRDTAHLEWLAVSSTLAAEVTAAGECLEIVGAPFALEFDESGDLSSPWGGTNVDTPA